MAIAAHPDDIEFCMAGTLLQLSRSGWEIHYLNLSSGNCGSTRYNAEKTRALRRREARAAARILGARWHPPLCDDLEILYDLKTLRRLASVVRAVKPSIVLTHSPQDYMEDHMNTCRLAVSAAFSRGMPNFRTTPVTSSIDGDVTVYHAMPHGLCDGLRQRIRPGQFVDTTAVHTAKRAALAAHVSQKAWLDESQGMDSYLHAMDEMSKTVGKLSRRFRHAEGWRRHLHFGFSCKEMDPLAAALTMDCRINRAYEQALMVSDQ
jgi:LmbE family N-acetylglucosaminyl deacetylase